jgi:hypothetical protein
VTYGFLSKAQAEAVCPFVQGREVYDLGAGDLFLTRKLVSMGASVVAVDKHGFGGHTMPAGVTLGPQWFHQVAPADVRIAFISWPNNCCMVLSRIIAEAETVIYLGKNTDGTICGDAQLFAELVKREVLVYLAERPNTLIVYGSRRVKREPTREEVAAMEPLRMYTFDELELGKVGV